MAESPKYYFQHLMLDDVCPDCGDYGQIIAICDFGTQRVIHEKCESCFQRWHEGWSRGEQ